MTLAALAALSAYSVEKDLANKAAILDRVAQMRSEHAEAVSSYQLVVNELEQEYMLP